MTEEQAAAFLKEHKKIATEGLLGMVDRNDPAAMDRLAASLRICAVMYSTHANNLRSGAYAAKEKP